MRASLRALLSGVIDYAGLFPPAELSLEQSIGNYARYQSEPESWMLGRFICPATRLRELSGYSTLFGSHRTLRISALGQAPSEGEDCRKQLARETLSVAQFARSSREWAIADVIEMRAPHDARLDIFTEPEFWMFFEILPGASWQQRTFSIVFELSGKHKRGFKLRTGGVEVSAFPPSQQIAFAITTCRDKKVPLKFTAGLHHPIRHFNPSVNTKMHGFINVFVAGVLAHVSNLTEDQVVRILDDEDPGHFRFDDDSLRYNDFSATTHQISLIRQKYVISFGSCSFDEPRDDLRAMDWL